MKVKNFKELAVTENRKAVLCILEAGLDAIDTKKVIKDSVVFKDDALTVKDEKVSFKDVENVFVVGIGKCSLEAAAAIEEILQDRIKEGIVIDVHKGELTRIKTFCGTHPFPSQVNVDSTKEIINLLRGLGENDLVICVISGGGSTLLCQPENLTCYDEALITEYLFKKGADIRKINTVRKHLSLARGGYLAKHAYPARVVSLIFSDVPGDESEFVASGPTVRDTTTVGDAQKIAEEYDLQKNCGLSLSDFMETPKERVYFQNVTNMVLVTNETMLEAMAGKAEELGFTAKIRTRTLRGEASQAGECIIRELKTEESGTVLLYGGETTVTLRGKGKGGRNQELILAALQFINEGCTIISFASDGKDASEAAGAIGDIHSIKKAEEQGLDIKHYLETNDSFSFFQEIGDAVITGDTGLNVSDIIIALKYG